MNGKERRVIISKTLSESTKAVSASTLAKQLNVSRQIVVGDVALLRAEGHEILATSKGYVIDNHDGLEERIIAVNHTPDKTEKELHLLVDAGVIIKDVIVEHPVYGELKGNLNIQTSEDIIEFINQETPLLSSLTDGIHLHTIFVKNDNHYKEVISLLKKNKIYYSEKVS